MHDFAVAHELPEGDVDLCQWVVKNHLLMSTAVQRKDITDPAVQLEFARSVGNLRRLHYLYLLTVADIRGTNPELWNSFKQTLLQSLHTTCNKILVRGLQKALNQAAVIDARQSHALTLLDANGINRSAITELWDCFQSEYFRQYQSVEIARQTESILAHGNPAQTLVSTRRSASRGATEILIYTHDSTTLFAIITHVLEELQLEVMFANLNTTSSGHALDTFYVLESDGSVIDNSVREEAVRTAIKDRINAPHDLTELTTGRVPRKARHFDIEVKVEFDQESPQEGTDIYISAADRPGILSTIARIFVDNNLAVNGARITTLGERIEDVFTVCTLDGKALLNTEAQQNIAARLKDEL